MRLGWIGWEEWELRSRVHTWGVHTQGGGVQCAHLGSAQSGGVTVQCTEQGAHTWGVSCEARSANQPNLPLPNMQLRLRGST